MADEQASRICNVVGHFQFRLCDNHLMALARGNHVTDKWGRVWKGVRNDRGIHVEQVK
jgi:hypothetical protein